MGDLSLSRLNQVERAQQPAGRHLDDQQLAAALARTEPQQQALAGRHRLDHLAARRDGQIGTPEGAGHGRRLAVLHGAAQAVCDGYDDNRGADQDQHAHDDDDGPKHPIIGDLLLAGLHDLRSTRRPMTTRVGPKQHEVMASDAAAGTRLDRLIAASLPELSRSRVKALIEAGQVATGGATISDPSHRVKPGQSFAILVPEARPATPTAQAIALDIVYEDSDLIVVNKPAGMVVHPAPGNPDSTLVNALIAH